MSSASYFANIEYMVHVDWALCETARFANIAFPGSTFLETEATRCNFEGELKSFVPAVTPHAGVKTWQILRNLATNMGVDAPAVFEKISGALMKTVKANLGDKAGWYIGGGKTWDGKGRLLTVDYAAEASPRSPSLTAIAHYKREVQEVGIEHFRVGERR